MKRPEHKTGDMDAKADHIGRLVEQFGLDLEFTDDERKCESQRFKKRVRIQPVRCDVSYLIALHEIGHTQTAYPWLTKLDNERLAWDWVMDNIVEPVDPKAWAYGLHVFANWVCDEVISWKVGDDGNPPDDNYWETYRRLVWRSGDDNEALPDAEKMVVVTALLTMPDFAEFAREKWQEEKQKEAA